MQSKKFVVYVSLFCFFIVGGVGAINYIIDPYGIYAHKFTNFPKTRQSNKMKLVKALKIKSTKPASITLGTSRTEFGYDPSHNYFIQPAYNLATSGASMYENRLYFEKTLQEGNLEKVLLVADWIMFNTKQMKKTADFEDYFTKSNLHYMFSTDMLVDSFWTILRRGAKKYRDNGQRGHTYNWENIKQRGGHLAVMNDNENRYYNRKDYPHNENIYQDTKMKAFDDFEKILRQAYENNIEIDIIFGPSHIRQWEAFSYYHNFDIWLQWKKDVVLFVEKIANQYNKKPFRIMDFSIYHPLTAEATPKSPKAQMKWHWEGSHYKHELGLIVLDKLQGKSKYKNFGVKLSSNNIDIHLKHQRKSRHQFINTKEYQFEVFGKEK